MSGERQWWYMAEAVRVARLRVDDNVKLTVDFAQYDDAKSGPLGPGDIGRVVKTDESSQPYKVCMYSKHSMLSDITAPSRPCLFICGCCDLYPQVRASSGKEWWYNAKAVTLA